MVVMKKMQELLDTLPQVGRVQWIGVRGAHKKPLQGVESVEADPDKGLAGDHYSGQRRNRQVTLIQAEHLEVVSKMLNREVSPVDTRRNIVVAGINLLAFTDRQFRIGEVVLEMTGLCQPCSRMEENLGPGGYNAMRGHGGITASVISGGIIRKGDPVTVILREND